MSDRKEERIQGVGQDWVIDLAGIEILVEKIDRGFRNHIADRLLIIRDGFENLIRHVTYQVAHSIEVNGQDPEVFVYILYQAIDILKQFLHFLMVMESKKEERIKENRTVPSQDQLAMEEKVSFDPLELQKAQAEYLKMKSHHNR